MEGRKGHPSQHYLTQVDLGQSKAPMNKEQTHCIEVFAEQMSSDDPSKRDKSIQMVTHEHTNIITRTAYPSHLLFYKCKLKIKDISYILFFKDPTHFSNWKIIMYIKNKYNYKNILKNTIQYQKHQIRHAKQITTL